MTVELLNIDELFQLDAELNGIPAKDGFEGIKGLVNEKISIKTKHYLLKLEEITSKEKKRFQDTIQSSIKEHSEEDENGNFSVPAKIKAKNGKLVDNPKFEEINKQIEELRKEPIKLESKEFSIDEFDIESSSQYRLFLRKFIKEDD